MGGEAHLSAQVVVFTLGIATIWCPLYALWLSTARQFSFRFSRVILTSGAGGHNRPETLPPFSVVLPSKKFSNQSTGPRRLSPRYAPQRSQRSLRGAHHRQSTREAG